MNMKKNKVKVSTERTINTYAELWHASYWIKDKAEKEVEGSFFQIMACLVITAFAFEAYLNHLGKQTFRFWDEIERKLSPINKLNVITEELSITLDFGKRPVQTIKELFKFRDSVAHGKTEILKYFRFTMSDTISKFKQFLNCFNWTFP